MKWMLRVFLMFAVCVLVLTMLPRPVLADDGCGPLYSFFFGCTYDQKERENVREHTEVIAGIEAQTRATELKIQAQQFLASQEAQTQLEKIASKERVDKEKILAELEMMYAKERMDGIRATTSFNIAALQTDAMIAVANARAEEEDARNVTMLLVCVAVMAMAGAAAFAAWQYRKMVENQTRMLLDVAWQQNAIAVLQEKGVPWQRDRGELVAYVNQNWVRVVPD